MRNMTTVIRAATAAGFELVEASEMNATPKGQLRDSDKIWRLPPATKGFEHIGESDRMTLKFRKRE